MNGPGNRGHSFPCARGKALSSRAYASPAPLFFIRFRRTKRNQAGRQRRQGERALARGGRHGRASWVPGRLVLSFPAGVGRSLGQTKAGAASFCFSNCYKALAVSRRCRRSDRGREPERNLGLSSSPRHRILIQTLSAMEITSCRVHHLRSSRTLRPP
jgi:hypothetical protein